MSIRFIDELVPNGKTFPIANANNIKGGMHYAATVDEMNTIHSSRLAPGIQCFVEETDAWYEYDFEQNAWIRSRLGNTMYVCTQAGVGADEKSAKEIGVLSQTSRADLESMTINEILTRAFFAEKPPFYKETRPTWVHDEIEVGQLISPDDWKPGTVGTYSYGYVDNGLIKDGKILENENAARSTNQVYAAFGTQNNVCAISVQYVPKIAVLGSQLKSSWDRTRADYNAENPTLQVGVPSVPGTAQQSYLATFGYVGYYVAAYIASPRVGIMTTLDTDILTIAQAGILSSTSQIKQISPRLKTTTTADITISNLPNSAYVYVLVPSPLKISVVKMLNGLTGQYDVVAASRFGKVSAGISSDTVIPVDVDNIPKKDGTRTLYSYTLWYIAKGDKNASSEVSPSNAPLRITITKASI